MIHAMFLSVLVGATAATGAATGPAQPQPQPPTTPAAPTEQQGVVQELQTEAELLKPLTTSKLAWSFLAATSRLPDPGARTVMRNREKGLALSVEAFEKLPEAERAGFVKRELQPRFYYYTGYGTPLIYVRPLDLLAENSDDHWAPDSLHSKRILDFGCGTIGHLRLLASLGADVTGIDVEPMFDILYGQPGDQGEIDAAPPSPDGKKGHVRLLTGQWPANEDIVQKVKERAGDGYDLFLSKNTLKRGYIHPAREADPSRLVHLGVTDEVFVKAVYDTLKPGGVFLIYNISPAQAPADKPYIPHADGECPFQRDLLEKSGFEIIKFDEDDRDGILKYWMVLGYNQGKDAEATKQDLFAWWTMCRKPVKRSDAGTKGEVRITRNYSAEYNAGIEKTPEAERAWPVYREARMKVTPVPRELSQAGWPPRPDQDGWAEALEHIKQNGEAIRLIREAASRPHFGVLLLDQPDPILEKFLASQRGAEFEPKPPSENPMLAVVSLGQLGHLRHLARALVMDSQRAYVEGDPVAFVENTRALAGMARHEAEIPWLIAALVSVSINLQATSVAREMLDSRPDLLADEQLDEVKRMLIGMSYLPVVIRGVNAERDVLLDVLQRVYTDDGAGDGVVSEEGWKSLALMGGFDAPPIPESVRALMVGRAAMVAEQDRLIAETLAIADRPMWEWSRGPSAIVDDRFSTPEAKAKFGLIAIMMPAVGKSLSTGNHAEQQRDATVVAVALEQYRRKHKSFPEKLESLVPEFLDRVPPDRFDGGPLKYALTDGKPVVYSIGVDRDDDAGRVDPNDINGAGDWRPVSAIEDARKNVRGARRVPDGDWVLWPLPREARR